MWRASRNSSFTVFFTSSPRSGSQRQAILAPVRAAREAPVRQPHHHLRAAEIAAAAELARRGLGVARAPQGVHHILRHARLDRERAAALEAPARSVDRILQRLAPGGN